MTSEEKAVLCFFNENRLDTVTIETAYGMYIPRERKDLERHFPKQVVEKVFGQPSHLENAERMLLEIEIGKLKEQAKYENLIQISYEISNACGKELDSNNPVWEMYADLASRIPIKVAQNDKESWYFRKEISNFCELDACVSSESLEKMKTWLFVSEEAKENLPKKAYFEYIFELVSISLKEIFEEVKQEIMGS